MSTNPNETLHNVNKFDKNVNDFKHEINELKKIITEMKDKVICQLSDAAGKIPDYRHKGEEKIVHSIESHPLGSVGVAVLVGFVLGAMLTHKDK